jgi:translation elongation factor EF-G
LVTESLKALDKMDEEIPALKIDIDQDGIEDEISTMGEFFTSAFD